MRPNLTTIGQFISMGLVLFAADSAHAQSAPASTPEAQPSAVVEPAPAAPAASSAATSESTSPATQTTEGAPEAPADASTGAPDEGTEVGASAAGDPEKAPVDEPLPKIVYIKTDPNAAKEPARPAAPPVDARKLPWKYHLEHFDAALSVTLGWVPDSSFDLFSGGDLLVGLGARLGGTVATFGHLSLAAVGEWNVASTEAYARGVPTALGQHRMLLGVEARYYFLPAVHAYGRLSAGAVYLDARVGSDTDASTLRDDTWEGTGSIAIGGAVRVLGAPDGRVRGPRLYVSVEGGYSVVAETALSFLPGEDGPLRPEPFVYDGLDMSGPMVAGAVVLTY